MRGTLRAVDNKRHQASCNSCGQVIYGVRYKCMHPSCPDYDLCANCESHPIPVHPPMHPLLKMKTPDTVIPTVYRVGGTSIIPSPVQVPAPMDVDTSAQAPQLIPMIPVEAVSSPRLPAMFAQWNAQDILGEPEEEPESVPAIPRVSSSTPSIPRIPVNVNLGDLYREFWPAVVSEMSEATEKPLLEVDADVFTPLTPDIRHLLNTVSEEPAQVSVSEVPSAQRLVDIEIPESPNSPESPQPSISATSLLAGEQSVYGASPSPLGAEALLSTPATSHTPVGYNTEYMEVLRKLQQDLLSAQVEAESAQPPSPVFMRAPAREAAQSVELTTGFCMQSLSPFNDPSFLFSIPKVQVLTIRKVTPTVSYARDADRYRLTISDGTHYMPALLAPESNYLITGNAVQKNTVISLDNFSTSTINGKT
jgi:hypothetical protein